MINMVFGVVNLEEVLFLKL